jgi:hypothetical protein
MKSLSVAIGLIGAVILSHVGHAQAVDDPFSDYLQRSEGILIGAGNAKEANEAIQTITPWPPYAFDRRIPFQGRQAVDSIERMYRDPDPFEQQAAGSGTSSEASGTGTLGGASPAGAAPATPMQPISNGY